MITQIAIRYPSTAIFHGPRRNPDDPKIGTEVPAPGYTIAIRPLHDPAKDLALAVKKIATALAQGENPATIARDIAGMTTASRLDTERGAYIEITDDRQIRAAITEIPKVAKNERHLECPESAHAFSDDMAEIWELFPMCAPRVTNALKRDAKKRANLGINPAPNTRRKKLSAAAAECLSTPADWLKNDPMDNTPAPEIEHKSAPAPALDPELEKELAEIGEMIEDLQIAALKKDRDLMAAIDGAVSELGYADSAAHDTPVATRRARQVRRRVTRPAGAPDRDTAAIADLATAPERAHHVARRGRRRRVTREFKRAAA